MRWGGKNETAQKGKELRDVETPQNRCLSWGEAELCLRAEQKTPDRNKTTPSRCWKSSGKRTAEQDQNKGDAKPSAGKAGSRNGGE